MLNISVSQSEREKLWLIELSLDAKGRSFYPLFVIDMSLFWSVFFFNAWQNNRDVFIFLLLYSNHEQNKKDKIPLPCSCL